ncbi:alanine--tRNA ligase, cytoplasmic-like [Diadema antillarum]|uniref:alanine--tRNA ligase, cytoplasmic-like n=1 Tax=Diadema antillarum TaxID=105358 RepID=UPI003A853588
MSWTRHVSPRMSRTKRLSILRAARHSSTDCAPSSISAAHVSGHNARDKWKRRTSNLYTSTKTFQSRWRPSQSAEALTSSQVRKTFLDYFQGPNDHVFVPSSSVVPHGDPTLLFTNAGMNQFKDIFQGTIHPDMVQNCYRRVVNSQKCIRVGGKHNDLDDVGKDHTHHTFFEMLGNWSFGDFFKKEACTMAMDLLTNVYGLPVENLYFTYFQGDGQLQVPIDMETREIWLELGVPKERVLPFGLTDNFWEMGAVGPCGPCSEIHFDRRGNRDAGHLVNQDNPDVVEIWNLVFMQFYRDETGSLHGLPKHHVDTGMGLERLVSIMQGVESNYDTDLFRPLIQKLEEQCPVRPYQGFVGEKDSDHVDTAYRAVADHVRMLTVAIADGCRPDSQKRGYVIKRVIRRAVRYATEKLKAKPGTLGSLVPLVVQSLGNTYPELEENPQYISDLLDKEEQQFLSTLRKGEKYLKKALTTLNSSQILPGDIAWRMYDAYGFPVDLTTLIANEHGLTVDLDGFEECRLKSREITSRGGVKNIQVSGEISLDTSDLGHLQTASVRATDDTYKYNYHHKEHGRYVFPHIHAHILALKTADGFVERVSSGEVCGIILDRTSFYAEQGGQEWDEGCFMSADDEELVFTVSNVQSHGGYVLHLGTSVENLAIGDHVSLYINEERREALMKNHTGTHLLNFALRYVLGNTEQKGSLVAPDRFRFDFSAEGSLSDSQLQQISSIANDLIAAALPVHREAVPLATAQGLAGVRSVAGETYPDPVTILSVGTQVRHLDEGDETLGLENSAELCGGTHVENTSHIRRLVIVSEKAVSKGVRRLTVVTDNDLTSADYAANKYHQQLSLLETQVQVVSTPESLLTKEQLAQSVDNFVGELEGARFDVWKKREMLRRVEVLQASLKKASKLGKKVLAKEVADRLHSQFNAKESATQKCLVEYAGDGIDNTVLLKVQQALLAELPDTPLLLLSSEKEKVFCVCYVPECLVHTGLQANEWLNHVLPSISGKGFGSETFARGRGVTGASPDHCVSSARDYALQRLTAKS